MISHIETDRNIPSANMLGKLSERLGVPVYEIMGMQEQQMEAGFQLDMARVYVEQGDYDHTFELIRNLFAQAGMLEHQKLALTLLNAECLIWTNQQPEAIDQLTDLQQRYEGLAQTDDQILAKLHNLLGTAYSLSSDMVKAYAHYKRAYGLTARFPDINSLAAEIFYNLGFVCNEMGYHQEALAYLGKAKSFFDHADNIKKLAQTLFYSALAYKNIGEPGTAEDYLSQSLVLYETAKCFKLSHVVKQQQAYYVTSQTDVAEALRELEACAEEFLRADDDPFAIYTYARMALLCMENGMLAQSEPYLEQGQRYLPQLIEQKDAKIAYFYRVQSKYYFKLNTLQKVFNWLISRQNYLV